MNANIRMLKIWLAMVALAMGISLQAQGMGLLITSQPLSQTVSVGQTASFSVSTSADLSDGTSYQWRKNGVSIAGAIGRFYTTPPAAAGDNGALFSVVVTSGQEQAISNNATLTVTGGTPAITTQPASATVNPGQAASFTVTATGSGTLTYQWRKNAVDISGATSTSYTTPAAVAGDSGAAFSVVVTNSYGSVTSSDAILTVRTAPAITAQPAAATVAAGQTASFSATASGTAPLTYQWRKNAVAIGGATSASYTTPATTTGDNGALFSVVVTNAAGSATSGDAILTVNTAPSLTTQPAAATVNLGQTATFAVTATGTAPLAYQWRKNGVDIAGATASSYTTPAAVAGDNGASFSVVVTNSVGSATSGNAVLTVNTPPAITSQPGNASVNAGQTATFSVTATGMAPLTYQWSKNAVAISGATAASYTTPAAVAGDSGATFSVLVTNALGSATSAAATLMVSTAPAITTQPAAATVNAGQAATFSVVASGTGPLSYQWQRNGAAISGATAATYTTPVTVAGDSGASFTVVVANAAGSATSNAAVLTVNSAPAITTQPANASVSLGATATFSVAAAGTAPLGYQWWKNAVAISGATGASYTTPATVSGDNGALFSVVVTNALGSATSSNATLTVLSAPVITAQPANAARSPGQTAAFSVTATGAAPLTYQWRKNGATIPGATAASYTTPALSLFDNNATFSVVVTNGAGSATSANAVLTVTYLPAISSQPANATVTAGGTATFTVVAGGATPLSYVWRKNGVNISGATAASYTTPATSAGDNGSTYYVIVTNAYGSKTSSTATLTVNSTPAITTAPANATVNPGQTATFTVGTSGFPLPTLQWRRNGVDIPGATTGTCTTPAVSALDDGAAYSVVATNALGSATSANAILTVRVAPSITTQPAAATVAVGATATFSVAAAGTAPLTYQWRKNAVDIAGATAASYTTPAATAPDSGALFSVVVANAAGSATSAGAALTVLTPPAITTQPAGATVGLGATATFTVAASGAAPLTYQWRKNGGDIAGATAASYTTPATVAGDNGALFSVVVTNAVGAATSNNATLTVNTPAVVTTQPLDRAVTAGATATFTVAASGTAPLTYQWRKNGTNLSGATAASYTTPATVAGDNGALFSAVVTNAFGSDTSANATLTVNTPPAISAQPASTAVNVGAAASFSVSATGTSPFTYQWRKNGTDLAGATAATYTTPATAAGDNGALFSVVVGNVAGNATSANATLTVNTPPAITVQPANKTVTAGATAAFSVTATGMAPLAYQWRRNGTDIAGASAASYTTPATAGSDNGALYSVVVTNGLGSATSSDATLTVNVPPTLAIPPAAITVNVGQAAAFAVTAAGTAPFSYQWRKNGSNLAGATASSYTTPAAVSGDDNAAFTVVVTNVAGSITSPAATLRVNSAPAITAQPQSTTVQLGSTATFTVTATASGTLPMAYQWKKNGAAIPGATSATYTTPATVIGDHNAVYTVAVSNALGSVVSGNATLTINQAPVITAQPASQTRSAGTTATFSVTATGQGTLSYQWQKLVSSVWTDVSNGTSATYVSNTLNETDNNTSYRVKVTNAGGTTISAVAILTVTIPLPVITSFTTGNGTNVQVIVQGENAYLGWNVTMYNPVSLTLNPGNIDVYGTLTRTVTPSVTTVYTLTATNSTGSVSRSVTVQVRDTTPSFTSFTANPASLSGPGSTTLSWAFDPQGTQPSYVTLNPGAIDVSGLTSYGVNATATTTYQLTAASAQGASDAFVTVTVGGGPGAPVITSQPASQTVSAGATATFSVSATGTALSYQWRKNGSAISGATAVSYTTPATTSGDNGATFDVVVTNNPGTSVTSSPATLTVTGGSPVAPAITAQPASVTVTAPGTATFSVSASGTSPFTYQWRKNGSNISGATAASYTTPATSVADSGATFSVVVGNAVGSATSGNATLTVNAGGSGGGTPGTPPAIPADLETAFHPLKAKFSEVMKYQGSDTGLITGVEVTRQVQTLVAALATGRDRATASSYAYGYDPLGQLVVANGSFKDPNGAEVFTDTTAYAYDKHGNRTTHTPAGGTAWTYAYNGGTNQLQSAGPRAFQYDANGAVTQIRMNGKDQDLIYADPRHMRLPTRMVRQTDDGRQVETDLRYDMSGTRVYKRDYVRQAPGGTPDANVNNLVSDRETIYLANGTEVLMEVEKKGAAAGAIAPERFTAYIFGAGSRLARLSWDKDGTPASERATAVPVLNGTFDGDVQNWTGNTFSWTSDGEGGGWLKLPADSTTPPEVAQALSLPDAQLFKAGDVIELSARIKTDATVQGSLRLGLGGAASVTSRNATGSVWQDVVVRGTIPADSSYVTAYLRSSGTTNLNTWFDNVSVKKLGQATTATGKPNLWPDPGFEYALGTGGVVLPTGPVAIDQEGSNREGLHVLRISPGGSYTRTVADLDPAKRYAFSVWKNLGAGWVRDVSRQNLAPVTSAATGAVTLDITLSEAGVYDQAELIEYDGAIHESWIPQNRLGRLDWFITDHLGSTKLLIDANGNHRFTGDDDPFGINLRSFGDKETKRFTGQILDEEQAVYYFGARYYLPEIGRFLSGDPKAQYYSTYVYSNNNPISYTDPDGQAGGKVIVPDSKQGKVVHMVVENYLMTLVPPGTGFTEHRLGFMGRLGIPDFFNLTSTGADIYEIKPASDFQTINAQAQADRYIANWSKAGMWGTAIKGTALLGEVQGKTLQFQTAEFPANDDVNRAAPFAANGMEGPMLVTTYQARLFTSFTKPAGIYYELSQIGAPQYKPFMVREEAIGTLGGLIVGIGIIVAPEVTLPSLPALLPELGAATAGGALLMPK